MADSNSTEQWKPIKGYEGKYEVSDRGRVRSFVGLQPRILNPVDDGKGYRRVRLFFDGKPRKGKVHLLVLEAFYCPRPDGLVCDHIDRNTMNNQIENLRWITMSENTRRGRTAKLTPETAHAIRESNETRAVLASRHGVSIGTISLVKARHRWYGG